MATTYPVLVRQISASQFKPVYFLYGEETFFLDKLVGLLEAHVLQAADAGFNQDVVYGNEINVGQLVGMARQYPVLAPRRLVVAKEAHRIRKEQHDLLSAYVENPTPSTVLALVWPDKRKPDGRGRLARALEKNAEIFESKPLYENKLPEWIAENLREQGLEIAPDAAVLLSASLGANLGLIENELAKMKTHLAANGQRRIEKALVHELVAIDKEFNIYELQEKLGLGMGPQAMEIITQMAQNQKDNPATLIVGQLFAYYVKLGILLQSKASTEAEASSLLGMPPFIARQYMAAAQRHQMPQVARNLETLFNTDLQLKGIVPTRMPEEHVLKSAVLRLLL